MSAAAARRSEAPAALFAALGDPVRLRLVRRLASGEPSSITALTKGTRVTRQAVTKHLRVLERAGVVASERRGRERVWRLLPSQLASAQAMLAGFSSQWDDALARLKRAVEE